VTAAESGSGSRLGASRLAVALGACVLAAVTLPLVAGSDAISVAAKMCTAALSVVLIPGSLVVLMVGSRQGLSLLEIFGLGIPVSLTLVQVATVASLMLHVSSRTVAWTWLGHYSDMHGSPSDVMNSPSLTERKKAFLHYQGGYSKSRFRPSWMDLP
jgi:hypothetical protein